MSAYTLHNDEFNIIVSYFVDPNHAMVEGAWLPIGDRYEYLNRDNMAEVAQILQAENLRSVNDRYMTREEMPYTFEYDPTAYKRPAGNIIGALDCLEYQSSETSDWQTTNAYGIIAGLRKHLLKKLAGDDYTWGIE